METLSTPADVVLFTGQFDLSGGRWLPQHCKEPIQLASDLWIGPLDWDLRKAVMIACDPPGENWRVERMYRSLYAFSRSPVATESNTAWWDADHRITRCMQLARLVRPTTHAYHYSARIQYNNKARVIRPTGIIGLGSHAFNIDPLDDGLWDNDVSVLKGLLDVFDGPKLPNRIKNALWMIEHVAWNRLMNVRWPLLVAALEALVHTDERRSEGGNGMGSTEQFVSRFDKLRQFVPELGWNSDELTAMYEIRSSFAHGRGGHIDTLKGEPRRLYLQADDGLRAILRMAIQQEKIAEIFASDTSIRSYLGF